MLPLVTGWMKAVEFNHEHMQQAAQSGFMNAWAAATYLVKRGVPSRLAHERIGKAVQMCLEKKCELQDLPLQNLQSLSPAFGEDFYDSLKLQSVLGCSRCSRRDGAGSGTAGHCRCQERKSMLFARRSMRTRKAAVSISENQRLPGLTVPPPSRLGAPCTWTQPWRSNGLPGRLCSTRYSPSYGRAEQRYLPL